MSKSIQQLKERARLAWAILRSRDGNLVAHAQTETAHMRDGKEGPDEWMAQGLIDMVRVFSTGGHSGYSAGYAVSALAPLLRFEPLGPLTGGADEWLNLGHDFDMQAQNKRCGHVFRRKDGTAYDGEAVIFREPGGACFISLHSRAEIIFPYVPKRVYADVPTDATDEQKRLAAKAALMVEKALATARA